MNVWFSCTISIFSVAARKKTPDRWYCFHLSVCLMLLQYFCDATLSASSSSQARLSFCMFTRTAHIFHFSRVTIFDKLFVYTFSAVLTHGIPFTLVRGQNVLSVPVSLRHLRWSLASAKASALHLQPLVSKANFVLIFMSFIWWKQRLWGITMRAEPFVKIALTCLCNSHSETARERLLMRLLGLRFWALGPQKAGQEHDVFHSQTLLWISLQWSHIFTSVFVLCTSFFVL